MLRHEEKAGPVRIALTDRFGGASGEPFAELNLGGHVGDDPTVVAENRRRLAGRIGLPVERVLYMNQVHGATVVVVDRPWAGRAPDADAMVTREPNLALAVLVADCVPVLLADPDAGVVGVAHAGRPGLVAGVLPAAVAAMRDLGATQIRAWLGPSVCGGCYEVPAAMRDEVAAVVPEARAATRRGTPAVDVGAGVTAQLRAVSADVRSLPGCTVEDAGLYSYRRDRESGRFAGLAWLSEP